MVSVVKTERQVGFFPRPRLVFRMVDGYHLLWLSSHPLLVRLSLMLALLACVDCWGSAVCVELHRLATALNQPLGDACSNRLALLSYC